MRRRQQRGVVLIMLLAVIAMSAAWFTVRQLDALPSDYTAAKRARNAAALARAKAALIGYVATRAASAGETDPGRFPCPEGLGSIGGVNEGNAAGNCSLPYIGRFPWETIGTDKLLDAAGEPLWYVVAPGWAYTPSSGSGTLVINSNCASDNAMTCNSGLLTVDGVKDTVALVIAPGQAMNELASAGCTARNQARSPSTLNPLDYLECYSTATSTFVTQGPNTSFNDQVVKITASEVLPYIEAAVADRFQKQFAPLMKAAYSGTPWSAASGFPFAVTVSDPTANPANKLQGASGTTGGLLPGSYTYVGAGSATCSPTPCILPAPTACTVSASDPRCDPTFVSWRKTANAGCTSNCTTITQTGGASLDSSSSCTVSGTPSVLTCTLNTYATLLQILAGTNWVTFDLDVVAANAGMTWKYLNAPPMAPAITGIDTSYANSPVGYSIASATLNSDGSARIRVNARVTMTGGSILGVLGALTCNILGINLCYAVTVSVPMALLTDQPMLDPSNATYSWFYRNRWPEVAYYSVATTLAPGGSGTCTTGTCLQLNGSADAGKHRAILVLGGQKLTTLDGLGNPYTQLRPATAAKDLLDDINANGSSTFEVRSATLGPNRKFNDRFAVIDKNP